MQSSRSHPQRLPEQGRGERATSGPLGRPARSRPTPLAACCKSACGPNLLRSSCSRPLGRSARLPCISGSSATFPTRPQAGLSAGVYIPDGECPQLDHAARLGPRCPDHSFASGRRKQGSGRPQPPIVSTGGLLRRRLLSSDGRDRRRSRRRPHRHGRHRSHRHDLRGDGPH